MSTNTVKAKIFRYDPDRDKKPYYQDYEVSIDRQVTIRELLSIIHRDHDGTLAFRDYVCYKGFCNTCTVKLNGKAVRSCATPVRPGQDIKIDPIQEKLVVRDLVVDFTNM
jgi:succinate dehydrogenase / fumarate reductase iron-sulfur subunit